MKKNNNTNSEKKQLNETSESNNKILSNKELNLLNPSKRKTISDTIQKEKEKNKDIKEINNLLFSMNLNELKRNKLQNNKKDKESVNLTPSKNKKTERK